MIKVALIITGTSRNYIENYPTWKAYLLDLYDTDLFFHTYNVTGYHNDIYANKQNIFDPDPLIKLLQPKKYIIDDFTTKIEELKNGVVSQCSRSNSPKPEYIKAQLYSIYMAAKLKRQYEIENNFEYDVVIKIRFDTIFHSEFDIDDIRLIYSKSNVILCGNSQIKTMKYKNACVNCIKGINCTKHTDTSDIVFISRSNIIDFYAEIYNNYDKFIADMVKMTIDNNIDINQYKTFEYNNKAAIYTNVPKSHCPYPEKILSLYLKDYVLLNYSINLDINRNIV